MKKLFFRFPIFEILVLLLIYSCRSEDVYLQQEKKEDLRFSTFISKNGKPVNYAEGFEYLMKRYDNIYKTNKSGINNMLAFGNLVAGTEKSMRFQSMGSYVEFNVRSQLITQQNGDKWMVFPKIEKNNVVGLVMAFLTDNGTKVGYANISEDTDLYKNNILGFKQAFMGVQKRNNPLKLSSTAGINDKMGLSAWNDNKNRCNNPDDPKSCPDVYNIAEVIMTKYSIESNAVIPRYIGGMSHYEREMMEIYMKEIGMCRDFFDCNSLGGGSSSPPPTPTVPTVDSWIEKEVDERQLWLNECSNNVYQKLKGKPGLFSNLLEKFDGKSILNLRFELNKSLSVQARTDIENVKNGNVTIALNPNYLGSSELGRASLYIHEMLHAYMTWQLVNAGWNGIDEAAAYKAINEKNLPSLLKAYKDQNYDAGLSEHDFISNYYIPKIVGALKNYDPNLGTDSEYEAIAWNGLQGTNLFTKMEADNPVRAQTISSIIKDNIKNEKCPGYY